MNEDMTVQYVLAGKIKEAAAHLEPSGNELRARRRVRRVASDEGLELRWAFVQLCAASERYLLAARDSKCVLPDPRSPGLTRRAGLEGARVIHMPGSVTAFDNTTRQSVESARNCYRSGSFDTDRYRSDNAIGNAKSADRSGSLCLLSAAVTDVTDLFKVSPVTRTHGDKLKMGSDR